jgi:class 3 adenylate cyclase
MAVRNAAEAPDRPIEFRVGINSGDVLVEDDDLHGDGVSVAARLEGMAEPGDRLMPGQNAEIALHRHYGEIRSRRSYRLGPHPSNG